MLTLLLAPGLSAQAQEVSAASIAMIRSAGAEPEAGLLTDTAASSGPGAAEATPDPIAADIVLWLQLYDGTASFADYNRFVATYSDWPEADWLRAKAELMIPAALRASEVITWFGATPPRTGQGAARLVQAHLALGQEAEATRILQQTWIERRLDEPGEDALLAAFADQLAPHHAARTDALLWRHRIEEATRMLPRLPADDAPEAAARIAYLTGARNAQALARAIPQERQETPALAYARYVWHAQRGDYTEAVALLQKHSTGAEAMGVPLRWSGWRRILARWEMREGRAAQAYLLAARHYLTEGSNFVDLEWLAGYLSLVYHGNPDQALAHFANGLAAASSPISQARMHYWIGRAHEVTGDTAAARAAFDAAATHQTAFYGLLAAERLGVPLDPVWARPGGTWAGHPVFARPMVRAALILLAAGERGHAFSFFAQLGRTLPAPEIAALGAYLNHRDEQRYAVLLGKAAAARGMLIPDLYFPLHDLAGLDLPTDPALALSIARRESEFNISIGSPVGALGLMQLMPATAREMAGDLGLPYSRARLTSDWEYNARLGAAYLAELEETFGPTPVLIAVGYNAGPSRAFDWMAERGDPRKREMDIIDWIEHIPFRETRNYVMRVTESLPIYRARLTGQTGPVAFGALLRGAVPVTRPRARPEGLGPASPIAATSTARAGE